MESKVKQELAKRQNSVGTRKLGRLIDVYTLEGRGQNECHMISYGRVSHGCRVSQWFRVGMIQLDLRDEPQDDIGCHL